MKKLRKLKMFFKSLTGLEWIELILIIFGLVKLIEILFMGPTIVTHTPVGDYTCKGGIIKTCNGSKVVAEYVGVE